MKKQNTASTSKETTAQGREFRGTAVSTKMKDTVVVSVERYVKHPKYQKFIRRTKKYLAHDVGNTIELGSIVTIKETRPMSRRKTFVVVK
jgi:small subunit ribosomal protein S17